MLLPHKMYQVYKVLSIAHKLHNGVSYIYKQKLSRILKINYGGLVFQRRPIIF